MSATGAPARYLLGVDLGQHHDYTALAVLERVGPAVAPAAYPVFQHQDVGMPDLPAIPGLRARLAGRGPAPAAPAPRYDCGYLERLPLGTSYVAVVAHVAQLLARPPLHGRTRLVLDATGVGTPVHDMFVARGLRPVPITIHGGEAVSRDGPGFRVPKRDLIAAVQVLLQQQRLKFARALPAAPALVDELRDYQVMVSESGHDSYNARSGQHDDLVLAVACAVWLAERARPARAPEEAGAPWPSMR